MHTKSSNIFYVKKWEYLSYIVCFIVGMLLEEAEYPYFAGIVLMLEGLFLYIQNFVRTGSLADIRGLFRCPGLRELV